MMENYTLRHPVELKTGDTITHVLVRRVKGKDMRAGAKAENATDATLMLIDRLCQLPDGTPVFPGFADELDVEDIEALGELVEASSPNGPETGSTL